jgi:hypothetical protein
MALPANHRHSEFPKPCSEHRDTKEITQTQNHAEDRYRYITVNITVSAQHFVKVTKLTKCCVETVLFVNKNLYLQINLKLYFT